MVWDFGLGREEEWEGDGPRELKIDARNPRGEIVGLAGVV